MQVREWADEEARRLDAHINRTRRRLGDLQSSYYRLEGLVAGGGTMRDPDELVRPSGGQRIPVRVDVISLRQDVDRWAVGLEGESREALGMGWPSVPAADPGPAAMGFLDTFLASIYDADKKLGHRVAKGIWDQAHKAAVKLGEESNPFPLDDACRECGVPALWACPDRMLVRCGNPGCGDEFPVSVPVPVMSVR